MLNTKPKSCSVPGLKLLMCPSACVSPTPTPPACARACVPHFCRTCCVLLEQQRLVQPYLVAVAVKHGLQGGPLTHQIH